MTISDRYRDITRAVQRFHAELAATAEGAPVGLRDIDKAHRGLDELFEQVGEIPRMRLEFELTPVLLKAHNNLDRARLLLEGAQAEQPAARAWELQQRIYRLLNDL